MTAAFDSNHRRTFTFTSESASGLFEVLWAWVNEDDRGITWNRVLCGSLDELSHALDTMVPDSDDVYWRFAAPAAWMARSRHACRLAAPRKAAERAAEDAAYLATLAPGEVPF